MTHYDSAPELTDGKDRFKNVSTRNDRKRSRDDYNEDSIKGYMDQLMANLSTSLADQDRKFSKCLHAAVEDIKAQNIEVKNELTSINLSVANIRNELETVRNQYNEVTHSVSKLKDGQASILSDFKSLTNSVEYNSGQLNDLKDGLNKVESAAKIPAAAQSEINSLRSTVNDLQYRLQQQQQRDRLLNLEVTGVPEIKNEDLMNITWT